MSADDLTNIARWMTDQSIFITGVSGFIGKVLLYKLLKSCTNISTIYVLIRSKKGKTMQERLGELLSNEIFQEFKGRNPEVLKKVIGIEGDICKVRLGIEDADRQLLQEKVTLVFHIAASVRFDDTLQKAVFTNTRSTKYALSLAEGMKNLKVFVYVSTAYTNCRFPTIQEKVIPTECDPEKMIRIAEKFDEHQLEVISQNLLKGYPNTYIFTKNLAENLVYKCRHKIPSVIYRPSIVASSTKEPKPGWCDSISSLVAILGAGGKGVLRVLYASPDNLMDYITVDSCVNALIVSAWYRNVCIRDKQDGNIVFNATDFRYSIGFTCRKFPSYQYLYPLRNQLWKVFTVLPTSSWYFHFCTIFLHVLPGLIVDGALKLKGAKPKLMRIYRKLYVVSVNLKPFMFNSYKFETDNFQILKKVVPEEERRSFYIDYLFETTEEKYFVDGIIGGRNLMGDPPEIFEEDVKRARILYWIDLLFRLILLGLFVWILPLKSVMHSGFYATWLSVK